MLFTLQLIWVDQLRTSHNTVLRRSRSFCDPTPSIRRTPEPPTHQSLRASQLWMANLDTALLIILTLRSIAQRTTRASEPLLCRTRLILTPSTAAHLHTLTITKTLHLALRGLQATGTLVTRSPQTVRGIMRVKYTPTAQPIRTTRLASAIHVATGLSITV